MAKQRRPQINDRPARGNARKINPQMRRERERLLYRAALELGYAKNDIMENREGHAYMNA